MRNRRRKTKLRCFWCHVTNKPLTRDHVVPLGFGGDDSAANIVRACEACNQERGRIVHAALNVFRSASHPDKSKRKALNALLALRPLMEKWGRIEREHLNGRSVSDKLGTPAHPFPAKPVGRALDHGLLKAARVNAEAKADVA